VSSHCGCSQMSPACGGIGPVTQVTSPTPDTHAEERKRVMDEDVATR
jgi:hypothetical protein